MAGGSLEAIAVPVTGEPVGPCAGQPLGPQPPGVQSSSGRLEVTMDRAALEVLRDGSEQPLGARRRSGTSPSSSMVSRFAACRCTSARLDLPLTRICKHGGGDDGARRLRGYRVSQRKRPAQP